MAAPVAAAAKAQPTEEIQRLQPRPRRSRLQPFWPSLRDREDAVWVLEEPTAAHAAQERPVTAPGACSNANRRNA